MYSVCRYSMLEYSHYLNCITVFIDTSVQAHTERKVEGTTQPTNLKRGRSERVSWGEAEEKSTVTVTLLQRRDKGQQL